MKIILFICLPIIFGCRASVNDGANKYVANLQDDPESFKPISVKIIDTLYDTAVLHDKIMIDSLDIDIKRIDYNLKIKIDSSFDSKPDTLHLKSLRMRFEDETEESRNHLDKLMPLYKNALLSPQKTLRIKVEYRAKNKYGAYDGVKEKVIYYLTKNQTYFN